MPVITVEAAIRKTRVVVFTTEIPPRLRPYLTGDQCAESNNNIAFSTASRDQLLWVISSLSNYITRVSAFEGKADIQNAENRVSRRTAFGHWRTQCSLIVMCCNSSARCRTSSKRWCIQLVADLRRVVVYFTQRIRLKITSKRNPNRVPQERETRNWRCPVRSRRRASAHSYLCE